MAAIWEPGTMVRPDLAWMAILDATAMAGKRDHEREDDMAFWIRTCVICMIATAILTAVGTGVFLKLTGL